MRYLILLLCLTSVGARADAPKGYPFVSYDQGMQQAKSANKLIFLYFGRYGCGWCDKTNLESFSDAALKKRYIKNYILVYIDAESGKRLTLPSGETITEAELGTRLNVFATPVFLYMNKQGKILFRAPGFKTVKDFVYFDKYVQGGFYKKQSINEFIATQKK
jgi:thioredoxin-related protein